MKLVFLQAITYSGIKEDDPPSRKRGIILSNFVALTLVAANILIFLIIPGNHNIFGFLEMSFAVVVFSFPILLNRWHFTTFSRLYECYLPTIIIFWYMTNVMRQTEVVPISFYDGLRFYLLAASCIPYLIFERKNSILLIAGILPNFIAIIFCDPLLEVFGVGYGQNGIVDAGYEFTNIRVFVAYVIINGICIALKFIVDDSDTLNARLISELDEKNKLIREQSEEQIRQSENKYQSLFEQASDAIVIADLNGNFTDCNPKMCQLLGYTREELIGMNITQFLDEVQLDEHPVRLDLLAQGEIRFNERRMIRKDGSIVEIENSVKKMSDNRLLGILRDVTARKQAEAEKERTTYLLNERIKERRTLYDASQALQDYRPVNEALQEIVDIMPKGWQYPEVSVARIIYGDLEFTTANFKESPFSQKACFETPDGLPVVLELVYLEDKPHEFEGPFLAEERDLINMLAEMIRIYLTRKQEADALKKSEANLNATINNTTFFIWSINRKYELKNINRPFWNYIRQRYGIEVQEGQSIIDIYRDGAQLEEFSSAWMSHYRRAMEGESFVLEEEYSERHFKSSLNPIIENAMVAGVTVFSEETTEHKKREIELSEANKQIDDLKLMALRAAMNPHFIFNTLNSIQYYIMENDQRNAVNYLSTFSKLIRSILNHSVVSKVKLNEELEMLRHYVTLEQMRFENKFDFTFDVDSTIDTTNIEIPSMLIQPFVENAILHGINNKPGRGTLKISVKGSSDSILFEVEDDGVGRGATEKLQQQKLSEHKSHGTALTQERLRLINTRRNVSLEIVDLDKNGLPAGTKVKIWIAN